MNLLLSRELLEGRSQFQRAFDETESAPRAWTPAVDVFENEREIVLQAELPGFKSDEIEIQVSGDALHLSGERAPQTILPCEQFHRLERRQGPFSRSFALRSFVDEANVSARLEDGVLTVRLPKKKVGARRILIERK